MELSHIHCKTWTVFISVQKEKRRFPKRFHTLVSLTSYSSIRQFNDILSKSKGTKCTFKGYRQPCFC
jgi:hypothetical protein